MTEKVTTSNFDEFVSKGVTLVDFKAEWCGPCKALSPILDDLSEEYKGKIKIGKLDVDENIEIPQRYKVRSIPTLLLFKDNTLVEKHIGSMSKSDLKSFIDKAFQDS
jgi:thioredoxin 1